jgi:DNA-binding beta-propeller fold protein YncE
LAISVTTSMRRARVAAMLVLACAPWAAKAQDAAEPVPTPFLMIDTEMHVGPIWRLAVGAGGTLLATASGDKSVRLFDVASADLLRKIHLPLGDGEIGAALALALSPDGTRLIAATLSFDSGADFDSGSVYVVDVQQGSILGRLRNLPAVPTRIAFAPDGRHFVLAMEGAGVQLRAAAGRCVWEDPNPLRVEPIGWAAFAEDGRLATVSRAGLLRIYEIADDTLTPLGERRDCPQAGEDAVADANVKLLYQRRMASDLQPAGIAFAPAGDRLAVGYQGGAAVDVLDLATGRTRRLEPPAELSEGNLAAVAWSRIDDRAWLFAGGTVQNAEQQNVLLAWPGGRGGTPATLAVSEDSITDLAALPGQGVVVASTDPTWSYVAADSTGGALELRAARSGERLDFREVSARRFAVDRTGAVVEFADRRRPGSVFRFDLGSLALETAGAGREGLATAAAARAGVALENWFLSETPSLNRQTLWLRQGERALAADVAAAGDRVLLGTDHRLRLYDRAGQELAVREVPTAAWGVVIVPDRPLAVVAHGDGSIRWYSLRDDLPLAEIAGLFVHRDGRRWVAWTADGFFAHGDFGGEALVGFQQNGTRKAPTGQWLTFQQVYRLFYDPARVSGVLDRPDDWPEIADRSRVRTLFDSLALPTLTLEAYCPLEASDVDLATRGLVMFGAGQPAAAGPAGATTGGCQPVDATTLGLSARRGGELGAPLPPGTRAVRVRLRVEDRGGGLGPIDAFIDGRNAGRVEPDPAAPAGGDRILTVERVIPIAAERTELVFRAYDRSGVFAQSLPLRFMLEDVAVPPAPPRLYLLAVGVDRYGGAIPPLRLAGADARTFKEVVTKLAPQAYGDVVAEALFDADATRANVVARLEDLAGRVGPDDAVLIYLAGHGIANSNGTYFFVTVDATSPEDAEVRSLDHPTLVRLLGELPARNVFLLLDTCYAGAFHLQAPGNLANESGRFVLTGSSSVEQALDSYDGTNGIFAYAVRQGLSGAAASAASDQIDALQLGVYVREALPELASQRNHRQSAVFKTAGGDLAAFPIAAAPRQEAGVEPASLLEQK